MVAPSFAALPYATTALAGAVLAWTSAASELPEVEIVAAASEDAPTDSDAARNDHRITFAPDGDPRAGKALAITLVTTDGDDHILDADIVVNGMHLFTDSTLYDESQRHDASRYDLQNVLTHELGHWFGLGENEEDADSTMYSYVAPGETKKRDLTTDDIDRVQLAYWQADHADGPDGCGIRAPRTHSTSSNVGYLIVLGWLLGRANRRDETHVAHRTRRHPRQTT